MAGGVVRLSLCGFSHTNQGKRSLARSTSTIFSVTASIGDPIYGSSYGSGYYTDPFGSYHYRRKLANLNGTTNGTTNGTAGSFPQYVPAQMTVNGKCSSGGG